MAGRCPPSECHLSNPTTFSKSTHGTFLPSSNRNTCATLRVADPFSNPGLLRFSHEQSLHGKPATMTSTFASIDGNTSATSLSKAIPGNRA